MVTFFNKQAVRSSFIEKSMVIIIINIEWFYGSTGTIYIGEHRMG